MTTNFRRLFSKLRIRRASFKQIKTRLTRNRVVRTVDKTFRIVKSKKKNARPKRFRKHLRLLDDLRGTRHMYDCLKTK